MSVNNIKQELGICYIAWIPFGTTVFSNFFSSYILCRFELKHELIVVFRGYQSFEELKPFKKILSDLQIAYVESTMNKGLDIDAYIHVCKTIKLNSFLFLNSQSQFLNKNSLIHYSNAFDQSEVGIVSATASYQSYYSSVFQRNTIKWEVDKCIMNNFRKYKLFLKTFFYWRFLFKPFPNPHVRTNAFMIRRDLFLQLKYKPLITKFRAYQFESGRNSMTNQILKKGLKVLVIDKNGKTYEPAEWKNSYTFWIGEQENLLVSDNQTRIYENASREEKNQMSYLAWGK